MKKIFISFMLSSFILVTSVAQNVGDPAPEFSFKDYEGNDFTLSDHLGKVVFIFTFGNTCPSCLAFGNKTETMVNNIYGNRDDFIAVGVDFWNSSSSNTSVSNFAEQTGITYPLLVKGGDMAADYNTTYDRLLVVDKEGVLRHKGITLANNDLNNALIILEEFLGTAVSSKALKTPGVEVNLYPQPASEIVNLSFSMESDSRINIEIFNSLGQLQVIQYKSFLTAGENRVRLDVSGLDQGLYFYRLKKDEDELISGRFIIKR